MPGIAGVIAQHTSGDESHKLSTMLNMMNHEEYYTTAKYENPSLGIYVGCVNVQGSSCDCMPIFNEKKDKILFLSGECLEDNSVVDSLSFRGHIFDRNNISYIIHLFEEQGESFFANLNGWYSGVIVDLERKRSFVFNDRYGQRKVYYYEDNGAFYFSSEAKSLLKLHPSLRCIDNHSIGEYIMYDCILGNRTFFRNILMLPAGSLWTFENGHTDKRLVYDQDKLETQPKLDRNSFLSQLEATFVRILPRYLSNQSKILSLSGGLDTRTIMACSNIQPGELPCFSHGGMYNEMLDVKIARQVAKACKQQHRTIRVNETFLADFDRYAENTVFITDGLANVCQSHLLFCNKVARDIARIKITGKFGSQVLKGISAFQRPMGYGADKRLVSEEFRCHIETSETTFHSLSKGHPLSVITFREIPWWWAGITALESSQLDVRSPYLDNDFVNLLFRCPYEDVDLDRFQIELIRKRSPHLYSIMTDKGRGGVSSPIANLSRRAYYNLVNLAGKVYERDKLPYSMHHWVSRIDHVLLSPLRINRLFMGLSDYRHYRVWFRDQLSTYIQEMLLDAQTLRRPYWDNGFLREMVLAHVGGNMNYLAEINKVLTIELVMRHLIENI